MKNIELNKGDRVHIIYGVDGTDLYCDVIDCDDRGVSARVDEYLGAHRACMLLPWDEIQDGEIIEGSVIESVDKNYESTDKMVSHPDHYQSNNGLEVIDAIEAFTDGLNGIEATDTGNIIKYACRWHKKNGIQDLEKILWYTHHLINHLKKKESNVS
jgi:hypothetical protein